MTASPVNFDGLGLEASATPRWSCQKIAKRFASPVLIDVSLDVAPGKTLALLGANGAGKSTLGKIIAGLQTADSGQMWLDGQPFSPGSKRAAERLGVHIVQQELGTIDTLSIAENLFLTSLPARWGWIKRRRLADRAHAALAAVGLEGLDPHRSVGELGVGEKQLIEIASALEHRCRLLVLDEPTAALTKPQIDRLFERLDRMRRDGVAMIYVSHRLDEIRRIADQVAVLRDGVLVERGTAAEFVPERAVAAMSGEPTTGARSPRTHRVSGGIGEARASETEVTRTEEITPPSFQSLRPVELQGERAKLALAIRGLVARPRVRGVDLEAYRGEIVGIAGLVGSGRTETLRAIFGADRAEQGQIWVRGRKRVSLFRSTHEAVRSRVAMVPEDRKAQGLALPLSVRINVTLGVLGQGASSWGWMRPLIERSSAEHSLAQTEVRYASSEQAIALLSGGNQQKVLMSRWLRHDADVLLVDEPTRGIDVASKRTLFRVLREKADAGGAILVVSSDLHELLEYCDVLAVMHEGRVVRWCHPQESSESELLSLAIGGSHQGGNRHE